jgi:hypothetical protein
VTWGATSAALCCVSHIHSGRARSAQARSDRPPMPMEATPRHSVALVDRLTFPRKRCLPQQSSSGSSKPSSTR